MYAGPETKTIPLRKPVTLGSITVTEINLKEPTGANVSAYHRALADATKTGDMAAADRALISAVSGIVPPILELVGQRDLTEAKKFLDPFLDDGDEEEPKPSS